MESSPQQPPGSSSSPLSCLLKPTKVEDSDVSSNVNEGAPSETDHFKILGCAEYMKKYNKYEEDYSRRLIAKYFSDKKLDGENIYEEKVNIGDEVIQSSRWHCAWSFADPFDAIKEFKNDS